MGDAKRPLGRHDLTEEEKARIREEAEARYRAEVEAELAAKAQGVTESPAATATATPPDSPPMTPAQVNAEKEKARRAALTPEQRKREDNRNGCMGAVLIGLLLLGGCSMLRSCGGSSGPDPIDKMAESSVIALCRIAVEDRLKAPSTARFQLSGTPTFHDGGWGYIDSVDAQNSFGAMVRTQFVCRVTGTSEDDATAVAMLVDN